MPAFRVLGSPLKYLDDAEAANDRLLAASLARIVMLAPDPYHGLLLREIAAEIGAPRSGKWTEEWLAKHASYQLLSSALKRHQGGRVTADWGTQSQPA